MTYRLDEEIPMDSITALKILADIPECASLNPAQIYPLLETYQDLSERVSDLYTDIEGIPNIGSYLPYILPSGFAESDSDENSDEETGKETAEETQALIEVEQPNEFFANGRAILLFKSLAKAYVSYEVEEEANKQDLGCRESDNLRIEYLRYELDVARKTNFSNFGDYDILPPMDLFMSRLFVSSVAKNNHALWRSMIGAGDLFFSNLSNPVINCCGAQDDFCCRLDGDMQAEIEEIAKRAQMPFMVQTYDPMNDLILPIEKVIEHRCQQPFRNWVTSEQAPEGDKTQIFEAGKQRAACLCIIEAREILGDILRFSNSKTAAPKKSFSSRYQKIMSNRH